MTFTHACCCEATACLAGRSSLELQLGGSSRRLLAASWPGGATSISHLAPQYPLHTHNALLQPALTNTRNPVRHPSAHHPQPNPLFPRPSVEHPPHQAIYDYFEQREPGAYKAFDDLYPIVTTNANFDEILIPADHVSRSPNDTYYVSADKVLRCHTSAHQAELLRTKQPGFLVTGGLLAVVAGGCRGGGSGTAVAAARLEVPCRGRFSGGCAVAVWQQVQCRSCCTGVFAGRLHSRRTDF